MPEPTMLARDGLVKRVWGQFTRDGKPTGRLHLFMPYGNGYLLSCGTAMQPADLHVPPVSLATRCRACDSTWEWQEEGPLP